MTFDLFHVLLSETTRRRKNVEVPAVWLGRAFDIAWPIRDGASALIRLQAARKIAQAHGGDLEVSAIDRGTAFLLTIPTAT